MPEQFSSAQAFTAATKNMFGRLWNRGNGFDRMPPGLERVLRDVDPDLPAFVYSAIEGGANQAAIEANLFKTITRRTLDDAIPRALEYMNSKGANLDSADVRGMFTQLELDEFLKPRLENAKTDADMHQVFRELNEHIITELDEMAVRDLEYEAGKAAARVGPTGEGTQAVLDIYDDINVDFSERMLEGRRAWDEAWALAEGKGKGTRNEIFRSVLRKEEGEWNRYYVRERAK